MCGDRRGTEAVSRLRRDKLSAKEQALGPHNLWRPGREGRQKQQAYCCPVCLFSSKTDEEFKAHWKAAHAGNTLHMAHAYKTNRWIRLGR